ncbi:TPA: hypothetical protein DEP94_03450 [Candidatus Nomurabacteria bacterium]|nr:hypothetical protein [Candidatus Nomurabacteria bacterium]
MKYIFLSLLFLLILFSVSHYIFEPTNLYYELWWLDIPMHILGGFGVASLTKAILSYQGIKVSYINLFLTYIFIATAWEIYEYVRGMMVYDDISKYLDTVKDLFDGFFGMSLYYFLIRKKDLYSLITNNH